MSKRKRVPISCLNCKKRKVKCDKAKPACSGCVKNGVAHLCEYLEPEWVSVKQPLMLKPEALSRQDQVLKSQRLEIEDLKRKIAVMGQLSCKGTAKEIDVLTRLRNNVSRDYLKVNLDFTIMPEQQEALDIYSWRSLVKLDPQLTNLWMKISRLQKAYHQYKMNSFEKVGKETTPSDLLPNEVDFTYSFSSSFEPSKLLKCPVIDCSFLDLEPRKNDSPLKMTYSIRKLWDLVEKMGRGKEKLNLSQIDLLLKHYFQSIPHGKLLLLYKEDIIKAAHDRDNPVFLCMASLVADEALQNLRENLNPNGSDPISIEFRQLFPSEVVYLGLGPKSNNVLETLLQVINVFNKYRPSLALVALYVATLNRSIDSGQYPLGGSQVFEFLIKSIIRSDGVLRVWKDPRQVIFADSNNLKRRKELQNHMCFIWVDIMKLINVIDLNLVQIETSSEVRALIKDVSKIIESTEQQGGHLKYMLKQLLQEKELAIEYHMSFLISRIRSTFFMATESQMSETTFRSLVSECDIWINELETLHLMELKVMLAYLKLYMIFVIFLQQEADKERDANFTNFFKASTDFFNSVSVILSRSTSLPLFDNSCTEIITRAIQIAMSILSRTETRDRIPEIESLLMLPESQHNADKIRAFIIDKVQVTIANVNSYILDKSQTRRLLKFWNFYVTFIDNWKKITTLNFGKIHNNVPGMSECPVVRGPSGPRAEFPVPSSSSKHKCPISHIIAPVDNMKQFEPQEESKGKCPVDHTKFTLRESPEKPETKAPHLSLNLPQEIPLDVAKSQEFSDIDFEAIFGQDLFPNDELFGGSLSIEDLFQ